ncbi:hypothetical protein BU17DRAFT_85772 [Hysterangium stoloniferum]|nr:hypothetical protein BU17DRAFT_85772 [Hysterangium stoloniferum]
MVVSRPVPSLFQAREIHLNVISSYSRIALCIWDILINLAREKELIWTEGFKASTLLYYMVRYPVFAKIIFQAVATPETPKYDIPLSTAAYSSLAYSCDIWSKLTFAMAILPARIAINGDSASF